MDKLEIRQSIAADAAAIEALYPQAFPDEDLLPLVRELLRDTEQVLSLVGTCESQLVGHIMFTRCHISASSITAALLGPIAVSPDRQRQGFGSMLVRDGLQRLKQAAVHLVLVLGDPAWYGRLGFAPEHEVEPPFALPADWADAWQSQSLIESTARHAGRLIVPEPWGKPELWAP